MGVAGAALATGISQFLSMGLALHRLLKTERSIHISLRKIRFKKDVLKEILKFGFPTALQGSIIDLYETKESAEKNLDSYIKKNKYSAFPYYGIKKIKVKS